MIVKKLSFITIAGVLAISSYSNSLSAADNPTAAQAMMVWTYQTQNAKTNMSPVVGPDGTTYISSNNFIYAVAANGAEKWKYKIEEDYFSLPQPTIDGTVFVIMHRSKTVHAINANGVLQWKYQLDKDARDYTGPSLTLDNKVELIRNDTNTNNSGAHPTQQLLFDSNGLVSKSAVDYALYDRIDSVDAKRYIRKGIDILSIDQNNNTTLIKAFPSGIRSFRISADGTLYVIEPISGLTNRLHAFEPNGTTKWTYFDNGKGIYNLAFGPNGEVYATGLNGNGRTLYAINKEGTLDWTYAENLSNQGAVVGIDGSLYVSTDKGNVAALDNKGSLKWKMAVSENIFDLTMSNHGILLAAPISKKQLYAIQTNSARAIDSNIHLLSPDVDQDGIANAQDNCPYKFNPNQENSDHTADGGDICDPDDDNDGYIDQDAIPVLLDTDNDGVPDLTDEDDDGDGVLDVQDDFVQDKSESKDTDGDGIGNNADTDDDDDGVEDAYDVYPQDRYRSGDLDRDGIDSNIDSDDDGDGVVDIIDIAPFDVTQSAKTAGVKIRYFREDFESGQQPEALKPQRTEEFFWSKISSDAHQGNYALGSSNSGTFAQLNGYFAAGRLYFHYKIIPGWEDYYFPLTVSSHRDSYTFNQKHIWTLASFDIKQDAYELKWINAPYDHPMHQALIDGLTFISFDRDENANNIPDYIEYESAQLTPLVDSDGDSVHDLVDKFPNDPAEWADFDNDGLGDNTDKDDDNDGVEDIVDAFPYDKDETLDTDGDGSGNFFDGDDDGDGILDIDDAFPLDPNNKAKSDHDKDGIEDDVDTDDDNDGIPDFEDAFPKDNSEWLDTDNDGIGNNADQDDDNDGIIDTADSFPYDNKEWQDHDHDGIGNNADADDDGDGVLDILDVFPLDGNETIDSDHDGIGNNADTDDDNDGVDDIHDAFPLNNAESYDSDGDGIGNNADNDDDNDGVDDSQDAFPLDKNESVDTDGDGIGNNADMDDDDDTLTDETELTMGTNPLLKDTDMDGIDDGEEAIYGTSAILFDTDGDDLSDGFEIKYGFDPLVRQSEVEAKLDSDNDGLTNLEEMNHGTHPNKADSDEDGLSDGIEVNSYNTNPLKGDSDGDGLSDLQEIDDTSTNPNKIDSDDDALPDNWEVQYGLDAMSKDSHLDLDGDGRDNLAEFIAKTNPKMPELMDHEGNDDLATAQSLESSFSLVYSDDIGDSVINTSEKIPHATVIGKGTGDNDVDYYQFSTTKPNAKVILDIDRNLYFGKTFDSIIELYDSKGKLIWINDDANWNTVGAGGSTSVTDSYLEVTIATPGKYYVRVSSYNLDFIEEGCGYILHVSIEDAPLAVVEQE